MRSCELSWRPLNDAQAFVRDAPHAPAVVPAAAAGAIGIGLNEPVSPARSASRPGASRQQTSGGTDERAFLSFRPIPCSSSTPSAKVTPAGTAPRQTAWPKGCRAPRRPDGFLGAAYALHVVTRFGVRRVGWPVSECLGGRCRIARSPRRPLLVEVIILQQAAEHIGIRYARLFKQARPRGKPCACVHRQVMDQSQSGSPQAHTQPPRGHQAKLSVRCAMDKRYTEAFFQASHQLPDGRWRDAMTPTCRLDASRGERNKGALISSRAACVTEDNLV